VLPKGDRARSDALSKRQETAAGRGFPAAERSSRASGKDAFSEVDDELADGLELEDADERAALELEDEDPHALRPTRPSISVKAMRTARTRRTVRQRSAAGQTSR
jgi:hypothetical protein